MQVINTNVMSLNAQRNLTANSTNLNTVIQRLSSGLRINSAKDDAAGLAISERFTTQIRGLNVAIRNANDGISLSQTTEGALSEISNNLQRIRELAVQARNFTNSASDRAALDAEVQQRLAEVQRTATQTSFNGQKVLDGSFLNASFQVGSNAGETIGLNLDIDARLGSIGRMASATSVGMGSSSFGGRIEIGSISNFDFSATGTLDGGVSFNVNTLLFAAAEDAGTPSSLAIAGVDGTTDFTAAGPEGMNVQVDIADGFDFSSAIGQFDVTDGTTTVGITLTGDFVDGNAIATEIQSQLSAVVATATASFSGGKLTIAFNDGSYNAIQVTNTDANAASAGFQDSAGLAGAATNEVTFTVDGNAVTLDQAYADNDAVAAAIQTQLGAPYSVTYSGGAYQIVNNTIGAAAPAIVATNAQASLYGWDDSANLTSVDGTPFVSNAQAEFVVDSTTVTLDQDFSSFQDLADYIASELGAGYTVTLNGTSISVANADGVTPVAVTASTNPTLAARAAATGFGPQTGGFTGAANFSVDGTAVTLDQDYTGGSINDSLDNLAAAIQSQLTGYTVSRQGSGIVIQNNTPASAGVVISGADANSVAAGIANATGVAGMGQGSVSIASGELVINGVDMAGDYASVTAFAAAINAKNAGVFATADTSAGTLKLLSAESFTVTGTGAAALGFGSSPYNVEASGSTSGLSTLNVLTASAADEAILRIDQALDAVNGSRAELGAIQNRFESVIANLRTTSENLTASRSRIRDADFAAETAELTRNQILQQAGIAMLAQANAMPQSVLSLLR